MVRRRKTLRKRSTQPKKDDQLDTLAMTISYAVESAAEAADEAGADIRQIIDGEEGLGAVFAAALDAVADTEPGNIGPSVFDAAMRAARDAVSGSAIPSVYDRVRISAKSIPDRLVQAAGQQATSDLFAEMSMQDRSVDGGRLGDVMKTAVRAAKTRLGRDDATATVQAAAADIRGIADIVYESVSEEVLAGAPVHAATVAVFEVAIRGVSPGDLANAIDDACNNLPGVARRHGNMTATLVAALTMLIAGDGTHLREYQTAVRRAEKNSRSEAADRIVDEIVGNAFEVIYMALVSSAYANSDRTVFESGHDKALAAAFGADPGHSSYDEVGKMLAGGIISGVGKEDPDLQREVAKAMKILFNYKGDPSRRKMLMNAMDIDYKAAVSSGQIDGIIAMYVMAYRAGYEAAGAAVGEKSTETRHQWW